MNNTKQLKYGALISYFAIAINILLGFLYTPWMIDQIGKSSYGLFTLANSMIAMFLVDFGLSSATGRYISKYLAEGKKEEVNDFLGVIYKLYLIIDTVIFLVLLIIYFFVDLIYIKLSPSELEQFKVVYIIAASFAIINFPFVTLNGILTAYDKFIQLKLADLIYKLLVVVTTVTALLCGGGLYSVVAANSASGLVIIAYKLLVIRRKVKIKVNFSYNNRKLYKSIFEFSAWSTVSTIAHRLVINITPSILGMVSNTADIAVFGVVTTLEGYTYIITTAIDGMFMPKISRILAEKKDVKYLTPLMVKVGKFQLMLQGASFVVFYLVGRSFITLWMGVDYTDAYYGALLLLFPGLFYNPMQIANTTVIVTNKIKIPAIANVIVGVINVVLNFVLSMKLGVIGACLSILISYSIRVIILLISYQNNVGLQMMEFAKKCYLRMSLPIMISLLIGYFVVNLLPKGGWVSLVFSAGIIGIIYVIIVFLFGFSKDEKKRFFSLFLNKN